jgi:hypothetical protein
LTFTVTYLGSAQRKLIATGEVLPLFSDDNTRAVKGYIDFVRDGSSMGSRKGYYPQEKAPYLGNDEFVDQLTVRHLEVIANNNPTLNRKKLQSLQEILEKIATASRLTTETIRGGGRIRSVAAVRKEFICSSLGAGHKAIAVARFLNCTDGYVTRIFNGK